MPDIRSFFGGGGGSTRSSQEQSVVAISPKKPVPKTGSRGKRKIVEDDEDEDVQPAPKKSTPRKTAGKNAKVETTKGVDTSTSDYFADKKPARSAAKTAAAKIKAETPEPEVKTNGHTPSKKGTTPKATPSKTATPKRTPAKGSYVKIESPAKTNGRRNGTRKSYKEENDEDDGLNGAVKHEDDDDAAEDIFQDEFKGGGRKREDDYEEEEDDDDDDDDMVVEQPKKSAIKKEPATKGKKRKSEERDENDDDEDDVKPKRKKATPKKSEAKKPTTKKEKPAEDAAMQDIFDSIPTVEAPEPPSKDGDAKFNWRTAGDNDKSAPMAGTADIPEGAENCLAGLTFVFTGVLDTLDRDTGKDLVKRYGGTCPTAPSSKTSYVVLGVEAGPKKLETIKKFGLKTINEQGLFELIRRMPANGGSGVNAEAAAKRREKEEEKIAEGARQIAEEEKRKAREQKKHAEAAVAIGRPAAPAKVKNMDDELWTVKYAPTQLNQICGNGTKVETLRRWLHDFEKAKEKHFKWGGPDGASSYRAVLISGGPGIGKTTAAHLVAKLEGYDTVETNASDTRNKRLLEQGLKGVVDNTSLNGFFAGDGKQVNKTNKKLVLIMDEVDGMSAGDRGGVGALTAVCKKTNIPIILIANDAKLPKMKPLTFVTHELHFNKPTTEQVRSRIMTILFREGMNKLIPANVVTSLIEGSNADIRRIINMISQAKLDQQAMDFTDSKAMTEMWEKNITLRPWDIVSKILNAGMWSASSKATLNDKIELYFNDHDFSSLMVQENYLSCRPSAAQQYEGKEKALKTLELMDKAAESISEGDLADRMIHGNQQHWSLMPTHAILGFVRPASFAAGAPGRIGFTSYLGKLSNMNKLYRFVKEIQGHMRLRASADRHDIRQQYIPVLFERLIRSLARSGKDDDTVESVIELMDSYFLTKDDWDALAELGVGPNNFEDVKIDSSVKAAFTRKYNAMSHPLPFMKASTAGAGAANKPQPKVKPDLEEAIDESDEGEEVLVDPAAEKDEGDDEDEVLDLKKDKYVSAPKKRKAAAPKKAGAAKKGKGKAKAKIEDEEDEEMDEEMDDFIDDDEEEAPKAKGKGKAKGGAKGKGKK